jgi:outer membrane receptor protein involved in Fe transport
MKKIILLTAICSFASMSYAQEKASDTIKKKEVTKLEEVTIGVKKKFIKIESDKTTVSIKDNEMLSTGTAYEAIKKLPGVIAAPTGGLSLNGKSISVFIDGVPSTLSGGDLENYLSSLPASAIEKAELIYSPGASYDANARGSIINLITNSKKIKGVNASVNLNYNFNKYQKPSPQILLNGKKDELSWQTMLGFNYIDSEERSRNGQTFTSFTPNKFLLQDRLTLNTQRNLYFRLGTNYKLSDKSNLLFNYNGTIGNDRDAFNALTSGTGITDYQNFGESKNKSSNHEFSLQYKTKLDTLGRTLDINGFANTFHQNPDLNSNALENGNSSFNNINTDFSLLNYYFKYDFTIPFEKLKLSLNTGGKFNTLDVGNTGRYNLNSNTTDVIDFDYHETNLAFYAEARKKVAKWNFTLGLRYEQFNVDRVGVVDAIPSSIEFKNKNLFPTASILYQLTDNISVSSSYSRKIQQPRYNNLDPNGVNIDQYNTTTGNILLDPTFYDNYDFKVSAFNYVQLGANYTEAKDANQFILSAEPNEFVSIQTSQQFDKIKTFSAFASFPIPFDYFFKSKEEFKSRMNNIDRMNYVFLNVNYIKNLTEGFDFSFDSKPIWNYSAQAQVLLPWDIKSTLTYYIVVAGGVWEVYKIVKPIQQFDISLNKTFMNKKLKVGLHAFDLFNSNQVNAIVSGTNLETNFYRKQDSRTFRISLSYNFGNLKLQKENTDIEVEKIKAGGGFGE